jgi:hypothetical protein
VQLKQIKYKKTKVKISQISSTKSQDTLIQSHCQTNPLSTSKYLSRVVLELLDVELLRTVLGVVSGVPEDLFHGVVTVAVNSEPSLAAVGEETLLIDTESGDVTALGNSTGVRKGQADGRDGVLHNVKILESCGDTVLGGVGDEAVGAAATDYGRRVR